MGVTCVWRTALPWFLASPPVPRLPHRLLLCPCQDSTSPSRSSSTALLLGGPPPRLAGPDAPSPERVSPQPWSVSVPCVSGASMDGGLALALELLMLCQGHPG